MSVSSNVPVTGPQTRVRRKPAPSLVLEARYPTPDPDDPWVPLSVLRTRAASALTFYGRSTSHLPNLPYTGGRPFPPDPYRDSPAAAATSESSASSAKKPQVITTWTTRSTVDITQTSTQERDFERGPELQTTHRPSSSHPRPDSSFSPPIRRRSQSAVSRKEVRLTAPASPRTSPYGHSNLQAYVLATAQYPAPTYTAESSSAEPSSVGHGSQSVHCLTLPQQSQSRLKLPSNDTRPPSSRPKGGKLARLLVKKSRSRLSLKQASDSNENMSINRRHASLLSFPSAPITATPTKPVAEENTFRPRRKSSALLSPTTYPSPLGMSAMSAEPLVYEALSDAELGVMSEAGSSSMHSHPSVSPPKALTSRQIAPARSQTAPLPLLPFEFTRPSTTAPTALPPFDEHALPTQNQLIDAAAYTVIAENGLRVPFGDLFRQQKVIVIFIRHFWCPLCQDYMFSISDNADPKVLERAGVNLVIISNGSYNMIKSYRQIFRTPFAVYTDPTLRVYTALGMTLRPAEQSTEPYRRGYVKHGPVSGIKMIVLNALRVGMPVWEKGGDPAQLGGEFVLGPGMTATYAHRMRTTRSHSPITGVLAAAGIDLCTRAEPPATRRETIGPLSVIGSEADEEQWMEERRLSLARLKEKKMARRLGVKLLPLCPGPESDTELSGAGRRRSTMMSRTESSIAEEQEEEEHPLPAVPDSDTTISPSSETAENGDTDRDSVETQTVADSDGESDRTRADEDDMQLARDYNKVEKLSFEGHPVSRPVITSVSVV